MNSQLAVEGGRGEGTYPASQRLRLLWLEPMIRWLRAQKHLSPQTTLLDVGCGTGDFVGVIAADVARADGFDLDKDAVRVARRRFTCEFYDRPDAVPTGSYDVITVSSVVQYLGREELTPFLQHLRRLLKQDGRGFIVISDIIPPDYKPLPDAVNSVVVSVRSGAALAMAGHLLRSALRMQKTALTTWTIGQLTGAADAAGLRVSVLENNLTPSRQRYSCVLRDARPLDGD